MNARRVPALLAAAFGIATLAAGTRVLAGADPGYVVYRPLLWFNTLMGLAYLVAAALAWRDVRRGMQAALAIFVLNLAMLVWITSAPARGDLVAATSVGAMSLRTGFWAFEALALAWLCRRSAAERTP